MSFLAYGGVAVGAAGLGAGVAALSSANSAPGGINFTDIDEMTRRRPLGNDEVLSYLSAQTLFELGAPVGVIEQELLARNLNNNVSPMAARNAMMRYDKLKAAVASGDQRTVEKLTAKLNKSLARAGASVTVGPDGVSLNFSGADAALISDLRTREAQTATIRGNRFDAMEKLSQAAADMPIPTAESIAQAEKDAAAYLESYLANIDRERRESILAEANKLGISPGGQLEELNRTLDEERARIGKGGALERALALITGQVNASGQGIQAIRTALEPSLARILQAGADTQVQSDNQNTALGLQLAIADAQAAASRSAGITNAWSDASSGLLGAGVGLGQIKSSLDLTKALAGD